MGKTHTSKIQDIEHAPLTTRALLGKRVRFHISWDPVFSFTNSHALLLRIGRGKADGAERAKGTRNTERHVTHRLRIKGQRARPNRARSLSKAAFGFRL